ncbi:hypothetical protein FO519_003241 [Halicephalobus sp. NKZ332]|nr:hypothetical protein FO519_003241 [Halicephalobus sp. NKZ332]
MDIFRDFNSSVENAVNFTEDTVSYEILDSDVIQEEQFSSLFVIGMAVGYILYGVAIIFGIPCNGFVLYRMTRFAKHSGEVFSNGTGICLFAMAIADIVSLVSISIHYILSFGLFHFNVPLHIAICKLVIFMTHVSTSVSIWSWLLMSMLRYLSVYYPLVYIRLWKLPIRVLSITFGGAFLTNIWLLIIVTYIPSEVSKSGEIVSTGGCAQTPLVDLYPDLNRVFLLIEIFWSFCIPTGIIVFVDSSVYLCRYSLIRQTKELEKDLRKSNCPQTKKNKKNLWRWLVIALIDVGLNLPEQINRMAMILGFVEDNNEPTEFYLLMRVFAQLLYYLQFSFNGVYLALFIYDKSTKTTHTQQRTLSKKKSEQSENITLVCGRSPDVKYHYNSVASNNSDDEHPIIRDKSFRKSQKHQYNSVPSNNSDEEHPILREKVSMKIQKFPVKAIKSLGDV